LSAVSKDEWDDVTIRDEMQKATEKVWAEFESWVDAEMAAEDEEWRILELGINHVVGLAEARFPKASSKRSANTNDLDSLMVETSFDPNNALDNLIMGEGDSPSSFHFFSNYHTPDKKEGETEEELLLDDSPLHFDTFDTNTSKRSTPPPIRSFLHAKLSSPDRKRSLSPSEAKRRYEAKLQTAENNREKNVAEIKNKAALANNRVKLHTIKEAQRKVQAGEALQEKLRVAEERHSEKLAEIKEKAVSENAKVTVALSSSVQNSETLQIHLQEKLKEVEARVLGATQRREQRLEMISGSQRKKNNRKVQQMSEFKLQLEKQKAERWEKLQHRYEAVQERRLKRLEELKRRESERDHHHHYHHHHPHSSSSTVSQHLSHLTLGDDSRIAKSNQSYSPKVSFYVTNNESPVKKIDGEGAMSMIDNFSPEETKKSPPRSIEKAQINGMDNSSSLGMASLSFDPHQETAVSSAYFNSTSREFDLAMSNSEEIELFLFPSVAKAHNRYLEMIKKSKISSSRNNAIIHSLKCLEYSDNFYSHYASALTSSTSSETSSTSSASSTAFQQLIEHVEETKKTANYDERGASSYNIYASTIKDIRNYGIHCNIDLTEKINFLISSLLDNWKGKVSNSLGIDGFIRSGGMFLLPVLISYEYGALSDLSSIQNFINSLVLFSRFNCISPNSPRLKSCYVDEKGCYINEEEAKTDQKETTTLKSPEGKTSNLSSSSIQIAIPSFPTDNDTSNINSNTANSIFQQIDYCNVLDLISLIVSEYSVDCSILYGLSFNMTLFDLCLYLHYLFSCVESEISTSFQENSTASPLTTDAVYNYSLCILRFKSSKVIQLLSRLIMSCLGLITNPVESRELLHSGKRSHENKGEAGDENDAPLHNRSDSSDKDEKSSTNQKSQVVAKVDAKEVPDFPSLPQTQILVQALSTFQQHSFLCSFPILLFDQVKLDIVFMQSSLQNFTQTVGSSPSYKAVDEFPSRISYFMSILDYINSIISFLRFLSSSSSTDHNNKQQSQANQTTYKHWLSLLRRNKVSHIVLDIFAVTYELLFMLLEHFSTTSWESSCYASLFFSKEQPFDISLLINVIHRCFEVFTSLCQMEPDLLKQFSSVEKVFFLPSLLIHVVMFVF
jgi:hypothetical protein